MTDYSRIGISEQEMRAIQQAFARRQIESAIAARDLLLREQITQAVADELGLAATDSTLNDVVRREFARTDYRWKIYTTTPAEPA